MKAALGLALALTAATACSTPASKRDHAASDTVIARPADSGAAPRAAANPATPSDSDLDRVMTARTLGSSQAPITVYEISDFQCPYCRHFVEATMPAVRREFVNTGKVRILFVNFPIPQLHRNAPAAHELAMCAADQGRFWAIHDLLYRHQDAWADLQDPRPYFFGLADSVGLVRAKLRTCLQGGAVRDLIFADMQTASRAGVHSTPSFVINGALLSGDVPMKDLRPILDSIYRAATKAH